MARSLFALVTCFTCITLLTASVAQPEKPPLLIVSKRTGNAEIFLVNAIGQGARNLTRNKSENSYPAWSPDGAKIAFASDRDGDMNIYVMNADGSNVKQLTTGAQRSRCPTWSPDGKKILFGRTVDHHRATQDFLVDAAFEAAAPELAKRLSAEISNLAATNTSHPSSGYIGRRR